MIKQLVLLIASCFLVSDFVRAFLSLPKILKIRDTKRLRLKFDDNDVEEMNSFEKASPSSVPFKLITKYENDQIEQSDLISRAKFKSGIVCSQPTSSNVLLKWDSKPRKSVSFLGILFISEIVTCLGS